MNGNLKYIIGTTKKRISTKKTKRKAKKQTSSIRYSISRTRDECMFFCLCLYLCFYLICSFVCFVGDEIVFFIWWRCQKCKIKTCLCLFFLFHFVFGFFSPILITCACNWESVHWLFFIYFIDVNKKNTKLKYVHV